MFVGLPAFPVQERRGLRKCKTLLRWRRSLKARVQNVEAASGRLPWVGTRLLLHSGEPQHGICLVKSLWLLHIPAKASGGTTSVSTNTSLFVASSFWVCLTLPGITANFLLKLWNNCTMCLLLFHAANASTQMLFPASVGKQERSPDSACAVAFRPCKAR